MAKIPQLNNPWLIAVWPGMGHVALNAGFYLLAKLNMKLFAEFLPHELFEVDHVEVEQGLIRAGHLPRSRLFYWRDPDGQRDLILFIGEAQPPIGKYAFCHRLMKRAIAMGVKRVVTFAAMGTSMDLTSDSRVFGADTDTDGVEQLRQLALTLLEEGAIGGLNGVLLGVAAERGLRGTCLLGEIPAALPLLPFPKASLVVLEMFTAMVGISVDLDELRDQGRLVEQRIGELIERIGEEPESADGTERGQVDDLTPQEHAFGADDAQRIEELFDQAQHDRTKAYELKAELDRLGLFDRYEDRFLDLFK